MQIFYFVQLLYCYIISKHSCCHSTQSDIFTPPFWLLLGESTCSSSEYSQIYFFEKICFVLFFKFKLFLVGLGRIDPMEMEHLINILYKHLKYPMENWRRKHFRMNINSLVNLYQLVIQLYISLFWFFFLFG